MNARRLLRGLVLVAAATSTLIACSGASLIEIGNGADASVPDATAGDDHDGDVPSGDASTDHTNGLDGAVISDAHVVDASHDAKAEAQLPRPYATSTGFIHQKPTPGIVQCADVPLLDGATGRDCTAMSEVCCFTIGCLPADAAATCFIRYACDDPGDCPNGQTCCSSGNETHCATSCPTSDPVCLDNGDCTGSSQCCHVNLDAGPGPYDGSIVHGPICLADAAKYPNEVCDPP